MKIDVDISNLGKLKSGLIKIRPITVLAGKNGTGKSFVTKSLYSIFNIINRNIYHSSLTSNIGFCQLEIENLKEQLSRPGNSDYLAVSQVSSGLQYLLDILDESANKLTMQGYIDFAKTAAKYAEAARKRLEEYVTSLEDRPTKRSSIDMAYHAVLGRLNMIIDDLKNGNDAYIQLLSKGLTDELKENFQVSDLSQLISFDEESTSVDIGDLAHIGIKGNEIYFEVQHKFIEIASSLSRVVFFESPAYWKVREALKLAKDQTRGLFFHRKKRDKLTGVPKYFYDLDTALTDQIKSESSSSITELSNKLENALGGEFSFNGDNLVFKDNKTQREVSKNLVSFGMTNIGMIHALIKNNVISEGSFVFIDEPETNLHPEWQVLLMDVLLNLAKHDVNIVIATHSIDMLQALKVSADDELFNDDFLSVHYFDIDGSLLQFDSKNPLDQVAEAQDELTAPHQRSLLKA